MAIISRPSIPEVIFERVKTDLTEFAFNFFQDGLALDVSARTYKIRLKASGVTALDKASATNADARVTFTLTDAEKTNLKESEYQFFLVEILTGGGEKTLMAGTLRWSVPFGKPTGLVSAPDVSVNYITATQELMVALGVVDFGSSSSAASAAEAFASLQTITTIQADVIERQAEVDENTQTVLDNTATAVLSADAARADRLLAEQLVTNAALAQNPLGDWNPATNSPALTAVPPAAPAVPKGSFYRVGTTPALAPFSGKNFTSGVTNLPVGTLLIKDSETQWAIQLPSSSADADLNATKVPDSGRTTGILIPELQYRHARGEAEMLGDSTWTTHKGIMLYEQQSESVVFNRVRIPCSMVSAADVTVRVYKSATFQVNPSNMTLLAEKVIPSGQFNTSATAFQVVDLVDAVRAKTGEYVFVAVHTPVANALRVTRWTVQSGAAPLRHIFLYTSTDNQWTIDWTQTNVGAGFAQTSFDLQVINPTSDFNLLKAKVDADLSGFKTVASDGNTSYGTALPKYQYIHARGTTEIDGVLSYAPATLLKGLGIYEPIVNPVSFDRIICKMFLLSAGDVTAKVYKSKTFTTAIASMTEIASVSIPSGSFNTVATNPMSINLPNYVHVDAGYYVYLFLYSAVEGKVGLRYWNALVGSGVERHSFLFLSSTNAGYNDPWGATTWLQSAAGFYATSFQLVDSVVNDARTMRGEVTANGAAIANLQAVAVVKETDGTLRDTFIPPVQYVHPRGEAEMTGVTFFGNVGYWGVGQCQQMSQKVMFDKVEIAAFTKQNIGTVTARVYKGTGFNDAPDAMTLLHTVDIPASEFNKVDGAFQIIRLPNPVRAAANEYIHVYLHATNDNNIAIRCFLVDTTGPARNRFKFKSTNVGWNVAWTNSSAALYATAFRLSLVDNTLEQRIDKLEKRSPRIILPSKLTAIVGTELSVYYDAIVLGKDYGLSGSQEYTVNISCAKGVVRSRYWRVTPVSGDIGTHSFTVVVYDRNHTEVARKVGSLVIKDKVNPATAKNYLQCGDSTSADPYVRWAIGERMATLTGGTAPLAVGSLASAGVVIGGTPTTVPAQYNKHEARGGWKWLDFATDGQAATQPPLGNPFWNTGTGQLDFTNYRANIGLATQFDVFSLDLGINDMRTGTYLTDVQIRAVIDYAKTIITAVLADSPACKILVNLPLTIRNTPVIYGMEPYIVNMWRLREFIISDFDNGAYHAQVSVGQSGICVDRYFGYRLQTDAAGSRYTETETNFTDDVHLRSEGYMQKGDALFASLVGLLQ